MTFAKLALAAGLVSLSVQPLTAGPASAQMMGMGGGAGHHAMGEMLLKSANLTAAQQSQARQIVASQRAQVEALHRQLQSLHEQLAAKLLGASKVTAADLEPDVRQMTRVEQDLTENMVGTALAIRKILTPEQVSRLAEVHKKLRSLHSQIESLMGAERAMAQPDN